MDDNIGYASKDLPNTHSTTIRCHSTTRCSNYVTNCSIIFDPRKPDRIKFGIRYPSKTNDINLKVFNVDYVPAALGYDMYGSAEMFDYLHQVFITYSSYANMMHNAKMKVVVKQ